MKGPIFTINKITRYAKKQESVPHTPGVGRRRQAKTKRLWVGLHQVKIASNSYAKYVWDFPGSPVVKMEGMSSIPGQGTKLPHVEWHCQKTDFNLAPPPSHFQ